MEVSEMAGCTGFKRHQQQQQNKLLVSVQEFLFFTKPLLFPILNALRGMFIIFIFWPIFTQVMKKTAQGNIDSGEAP